ncbi:beta-N-acetylglucosaminidase domain-containing protein [Streptomyces sp. NPDC058766]|uniref:beta-N-acetylglucosaminidase domain-containing protein n=1 Tax=Streptomyces sp. NPDC058766 TaxID=3346630 RepID=UPI0036AD7FAF
MRHGKRAAVLAVAVVAGSLAAPPAATAAPAPPGTTAAPVPDRAGPGLSVWPRPQSLRPGGPPVTVPDEVALVTDAQADAHAVETLRALLRQAGARRLTDSPRPGALTVRARTEPVRPGDRHALPSGGYELSVGPGGVSLAGTGPDGLFHAVQTLRQLTRPDGTITAAVVRDWPGTAVRGITEGFYGTPWTHRQRLAQLDFMGRTKQNRYQYAPGDDLYRQARWREPYPAAQRAQFRELAERARRNHVTPGWSVAPGQAMCFSSDADVRALNRKLDAMWALGFRAFQLQFQDVSYSEWHCEEDAGRFGSGPEAAARAQARVADAVARHLADRHPGAARLSLMPTEYYEDGTTDYRRALARTLAADVEVAWTGVGVVPRTITGRELAEAREAFAHPLVTMDNYPVNDYDPGRLFLGPYRGREPAVATGSAALLANAMQQPEASRVPLFTAADYAWNPRAYRPGESWRAAIADLAGGDRRREEAVAALAGNGASSVLDDEESAYLRPLTEAYWRSRGADGAEAGEDAARRLRRAFTVLRELPRRLSGTGLGTEVAPWSEQLARYGEAGTAALDMLDAQSGGDAAAAWAAYRALGSLRSRLASSPAEVGTDVLDPFLQRAQKAYASWSGIAHEPPRNPGDGRSLRFGRPRSVTAVTVLTDPGTQGAVEVHVPERGWREAGRLDASGATEAGLRAEDRRETGAGARGRPDRRDGPAGAPAGQLVDAVRVTGPSSARVRHLVPWFTDAPATSLELDRDRADMETGRTERLTARLGSLRPADARGGLTAEAPEGVRVRVPKGALTVPRGTTVEVPVEVTVEDGAPMRSYDVRLRFGGAARTLTVRAFPPAGGPDLARTGTARSSGDETPDFPASAANDGDPATRWSSPVEDGAWWQVELPRPARLGRVVLHWQDAHPSVYRVQVSPDGRRWRTAAAVRDGRGGRESVRMDERGVRFVRVQGEKRATRFGYSLWSAEAYAVTD